MVDGTRDAPVLVLITRRPEALPISFGQANVTALTLSRLSRRQSAKLIAGLTGGKALPAELLERIVAQTDGVPLFIEELTRAVLEGGLVADRGDHYALAGPLTELAIPDTLHDSLTARLDRLGPVKEVAQIAAVIGREFSYELLAAVAGLPEAELQGALRQLSAAELVFGAASRRMRCTPSSTSWCRRPRTTPCCASAAPSCTGGSRARSPRTSRRSWRTGRS